MKKIIQISKTLFTLTFFILLTSCNQDDVQSLSLQDNSLVSYTDRLADKEYNYDFYSASENFAEIQNLVQKEIEDDLDEIAYILVFYASQVNSQFDVDKAIGISIMGYKNNDLVQRYYKKDNSSWKNEISLNQPMNHLYTLTFNLLTHYTSEQNKIDDVFTIVLQNPKNLLLNDKRFNGSTKNKSKKNYHFINLESILINKIKDKNCSRFYFSKMENDFNIYSIDESIVLQRQGCTSGCTGMGGALCQPSAGSCGNHAEYEGSCKVNPLQNQINLKSLTLTTFAFDQLKFYSIRDQILANTDLGQDYIDDYYTISQFINVEDLSISTLTKIINVTPKIYSAYNNYEANNGGIIVNTQLKNELKSIMLDIKSLDSGNNYSTIIDKLVSDLEINANKTRTQIDAFLQN